MTAKKSANRPWIRDVALARKLTLVLAIKVCFIFAMKQLWFSEPKAENMTMPTDAVEQHVLGRTIP